MSITTQDVAHVANLARLALTDNEMEQYTNQLNKILQHAEELQKLDLENVQPTSHVLPIHNVMREDKSRVWLTNEQALANAPDKDAGQFRVPAVMEG
ncbi:Asp-tRNA(Asn)/Glu-tRNA(Gln) amidotransferase subunit GatC [Effusibacillus lacus]|uniref:Aspartyl/glutamyl-tRNA(Asn/Gln) amidotransferase subunit C n=1 Tax=Effusibacillus lacus TaxID=1348429 RepID=A0A292YRP3_9BACL|nr:Asp-tRNA(Asn)/Glu-tRNA(Gln) amidotransferase subunit GatC [Effusibacillus lacus]TCS76824.1 aspartyl/glutamyl-tRNA(Asn/Gln) amidotransferase subunit C [Effusibacillus lacus]GAX91155.1 asparaginyl/glutamyl-tRNA amidotransferase subunit C [Effusibacillus lacus]